MVQVLLRLAVAGLFLGLGGRLSHNDLQNESSDNIDRRQYYNQQELRASGRQSNNRRHGSSSRSDFECKVDNDLIMVLDSSAGMKEDDFKKAKEFFADFADAFNSHRHNRLGFKVFAIQPQTIFDLTNIHTPSEMRTHIMSSPYFGKGQLDAYFHYALADSYSELKRLNRSIVDQNFVLITAGPSKEASSISVEAAKMIKAGVRNFAVGIGQRVVRSQLLAITGGDEENIRVAPDFNGLKGILDELIKLVCSDKAPVCHEENDLMVTLDDSGSVHHSDLQKGKEFVAKLFDSFVMSNMSRVSFRAFSDIDRSIFKLDNKLTRAQIQNAVLTFPQRGQTTATDKTIDAAIQEYKTLGRSAPKNLLVITDGRSDNSANTKKAAERANAAGLNTFAVGIGSAYYPELLTIANGNEDRVFEVNDFDELQEILEQLSVEICN